MGAAGAVKNGWGRGVCLTTPVAGALRSLMVWDGCGWWNGCGSEQVGGRGREIERELGGASGLACETEN